MAESPRSLIAPPAPTIRCQGTSNEPRSAATTCRAAPGKPAARAIAPYDDTSPRGTFRIVARISFRIAKSAYDKYYPWFDQKLSHELDWKGLGF
jgi:hypothetical protein